MGVLKLYALEPLKRQASLNTKRKVWAFDIETRDGLLGCEFYCAALANSSGFSMVSTNLSEIVSYLFSISSKYYTVVYVHNLGFDVRFLMDFFNSSDIDFDLIESGSNVISLILREQRIRFIDSFQFLFCSQDRAEEEWSIDENIRKIDCRDIFNKPFSSWTISDKSTVLAHNENDVLALSKIMYKLRLTLFELCNVDVLTIFTVASMAMKAFRKTLNEGIGNPLIFSTGEDRKTWTKQINVPVYDFIKSGYYGGRTERIANLPNSRLLYADICSMYPFVMKKYDYPVGSYFWLTSEMISSNAWRSHEGFADVVVECPRDLHLPFLPKRYDDRLLFPTGTFSTTVSLFDLRKAIDEFGYTLVEMNKCLCFSSKRSVFRDYVDMFFAEKKASEGGRRILCKILLNSLYGKFGQRYKFENSRYHYFSDVIDFEEYASEEGIPIDVAYSRVRLVNGVYVYSEKIVSSNVHTYLMPHISAYVTSYARYELYVQAIKVGSHNVMYMDTDSLVITEEQLSKIKLGSELGDWEIEQTFDFFYSFAPKCYVYSVEGRVGLKCKGLHKRVVHIITKKLQEMHESGEPPMEIVKHVRTELMENDYEVEQYAKHKESVIHSGSVLSVKVISKQFTLLDKKRVYDDRNFQSSPILLCNA